MWWSTLSKSLCLKDGRRVETLSDARSMILLLPPADQAQDRWRCAAAMLMTAATTGRHDHIAIATGLLEHALTDPTRSSVKLAGDVSKKPPARSIRRRTVKAKRRA